MLVYSGVPVACDPHALQQASKLQHQHYMLDQYLRHCPCVCTQFDKLVSALIGVHAFTVLGPQVLVLQKMLAAIWPKGKHLRTTVP